MTKNTQPPSVISRWNNMPLYWRILIALVAGLLTGIMLGKRALIFELPSKIILQLLGALAPPLILIAVIHVLMTTEISGKTARRLAGLLMLNTLVAILIGLGVANVMQPGSWSKLETPPTAADKAPDKAISPVDLLLQNIPRSLLGPLGDQSNVIGVIIIAIAFGIGLRSVKHIPTKPVQDVIEVAYAVLLKVLHWIIALVPLGVFAIVAKIVGTQGFGPFKAMGAFIVAVLVALLLQTGWYLIRCAGFPARSASETARIARRKNRSSRGVAVSAPDGAKIPSVSRSWPTR